MSELLPQDDDFEEDEAPDADERAEQPGQMADAELEEPDEWD